MDYKVIALFLIALIGGIGGGFGLGYLFFQPRIQNLENSVSSMQNKTWHEVFSFYGNSSTSTSTFQLKSSKIRVMYSMGSSDPNTYVSFLLVPEGKTRASYVADWACSGRVVSTNAEFELEQTGNYYLGIETYLTPHYWVSIWDYY